MSPERDGILLDPGSVAAWIERLAADRLIALGPRTVVQVEALLRHLRRSGVTDPMEVGHSLASLLAKDRDRWRQVLDHFLWTFVRPRDRGSERGVGGGSGEGGRTTPDPPARQWAERPQARPREVDSRASSGRRGSRWGGLRGLTWAGIVALAVVGGVAILPVAAAWIGGKVQAVMVPDDPGTGSGGQTTTGSGGQTTAESGGETTTGSGGQTTTGSGGQTTTESARPTASESASPAPAPAPAPRPTATIERIAGPTRVDLLLKSLRPGGPRRLAPPGFAGS